MSQEPIKLGKYEILRELGRGAMGVVYEAFDSTIERTVALKTIRRDQLEGGEAQDVIARFQREAKAAGRLNHPNIVAVYDFGIDGDTTFIAMEFVHGRELKDYFEKKERFSVDQIDRLMGELLAALEYSHNYGVVHRDIKPANIIIQPDGHAKVADFGIARIESSQYTQAGTVLGTPAYMSPEQFMGQTVDRRSDIFSAAIVLYQFLTGEKPFSGTATTIMHKVLSVDPPPPSVLNVQVPRPFDAIVAKAIAKRPEDRYQTAAEFATAIHEAAQGRSVAETPRAHADNAADGTVVNRAAGGEETKTLQLASATTAAAGVHKRRAPALLAALGVAIVAIGGIGYFLSRPQQPAAPATEVVAGTKPAAPRPTPASAPERAEPGTMIISAVGLADPKDAKYGADKALMTADLRADSRSQLVEKAIALYLDRASVADNYDLLRERLLSKSGNYIGDIVQQGEPQLGPDGLMYVTMRAAVKVREVQKSLNQMSRDERINFIRNNGDPKISVAISIVDGNDATAQNSQIADNLLKERIKSFGFRIWSDDMQNAQARGSGPDFAVVGEAKLKKLSAKLAASGITIDKYMLTSWTVKCVDKESGEEIYYNNQLPNAAGSWATQEQALAAIGAKIADQFSRDFFMQHFDPSARRAVLRIEGLPDRSAEDVIARELLGLQSVISAVRHTDQKTTIYDLTLSGGARPLAQLVSTTVLQPLNAKLAHDCFGLGEIDGEQITVKFDPACGSPAVMNRLMSYPPASLYAAPPARQRSVLKDPESIRKLTI